MFIKKNNLIIFIIGMILIIASFPIVFIIVFNTQEQENIRVEFVPSQIKSYPNHTAWLLLDIKTKNQVLMSNLSLNIVSNSSIDMERLKISLQPLP